MYKSSALQALVEAGYDKSALLSLLNHGCSWDEAMETAVEIHISSVDKVHPVLVRFMTEASLLQLTQRGLSQELIIRKVSSLSSFTRKQLLHAQVMVLGTPYSMLASTHALVQHHHLLPPCDAAALRSAVYADFAHQQPVTCMLTRHAHHEDEVRFSCGALIIREIRGTWRAVVRIDLLIGAESNIGYV